MRTYELTCVFRTTEGQYDAGKTAVKELLDGVGATVKSEEDRGDRELAYEVDKEQRGHYHLYVLDIDPDSIIKVDEALKLKTEVLKFLFVRKES